MNNTKLSILITLFSCSSQGRTHYTLVRINKIIELLEKMHKTKVCRRWVFQCIRDMIDAGLLSRKSRYKHRSDGTIEQLSSIIAISLKGAKLLISKRVSGAFLLLKNILAWIKNKDKRFPSKNKKIPAGLEEIDPGEQQRLDEMLGEVTKTFPA